MVIEETPIPGVLLIKPRVFEDPRGFFLETWNKEKYLAAGFPDVTFVQDNHSRSNYGVLRGLHFQVKQPQGKLVQVTRGSVFDVAVDIRKGSPTFGKWFGVSLDDKNHWQLWVPPGLAHAFCVTSEIVDFTYKCTDFYNPNDEGGIVWNDPGVGIEWPVDSPILSDKDKAYTTLAEAPPEILSTFEK